MKLKLLLLLIIVGIINSCGPTRKLVSLESDIEDLYQQGMYEQVLQKYDQLELMARESEDTIRQSTSILAGKSAYQAGFYDQVHRYFEMTEFWENDPELVLLKGLSYRNAGRNNDEYQHWTNHLSLFEKSEHYNDILIKIYGLEQSMGKYEEATATWELIPERNDPSLMLQQVIILENLEKEEDAVRLSDQILEIDPEYEPAVFWKARYYFEKAENWYQEEMAKYNENPNFTTYAYLRRELRKISADFRTARDLFIELHEMNPENVVYMQFLRNAYLRLEMRTEAARMEQLINQANE